MTVGSRGICSTPAVLVCLLLAPAAPAALVANFDDGTMGDLDSLVNISSRSLTAAVRTDIHGLPDADNELYIGYGYGSPGQDKAAITTGQAFTDVAASAVVGLFGTGYSGGGGGLAAGVPASGGSGYLLYLANCWSDGGGVFWDDSLTSSSSDFELVLVRMAAGSSYPLDPGNLVSAVKLTGFVQDAPNFLRLTVAGNQVTGEAWLGQATPAGAASATVGFSDPSPLSGYAGVYLACRNAQSPYSTNWGEVAVDDFAADVPEPASLLLLTVGTISLVGRRRR